MIFQVKIRWFNRNIQGLQYCVEKIKGLENLSLFSNGLKTFPFLGSFSPVPEKCWKSWYQPIWKLDQRIRIPLEQSMDLVFQSQTGSWFYWYMGLYEHSHRRNNGTDSENLDLIRSMIGPEYVKQKSGNVKESKPNSKFLCMKQNKTHKSLYETKPNLKISV